MITEDLEKGKTYSIEWVDGDFIARCEFVREHNGFLIFIDEYSNKVVCRRSRLRNIKEVRT